MIYFDTCYLLKCHLAEPGHEAVRALAREAGPVACCKLGRTEWHAGIHRHLREGKLTAEQAALAREVMRADDAAGLWVWLPLSDEVMAAANREFVRLPATVFLRSADALHLACAREQGFSEIYSHDRHLLAAAPHFGLRGRNVL
jgi:predicted nucleic acid-binding protein